MYSFYRPFTALQQQASFPLNVTESDNAYTVRAALPGLAKDRIAVRIDEAVVHLEVDLTRQHNDAEKALWVDAQYQRHGKANRQIELPQAVDADAAQARYENGELILNLPKKHAKPLHVLTII